MQPQKKSKRAKQSEDQGQIPLSAEHSHKQSLGSLLLDLLGNLVLLFLGSSLICLVYLLIEYPRQTLLFLVKSAIFFTGIAIVFKFIKLMLWAATGKIAGRDLASKLFRTSLALSAVGFVASFFIVPWRSVLQDLATMSIGKEIVAPLVVAGISGFVAFFWKRHWERKAKEQEKLTKELERRVRNAPEIYAKELDDIIQKAVAEGQENAIINARAIVGVRDTMRQSLESIGKYLNSEIDTLAKQLNLPFSKLENMVGDGKTDKAEIFETIKVLEIQWPKKRVVMQVEVRKLLAMMGLNIDAVEDSKNSDS